LKTAEQLILCWKEPSNPVVLKGRDAISGTGEKGKLDLNAELAAEKAAWNGLGIKSCRFIKFPLV
jgi:hypothetical protein